MKTFLATVAFLAVAPSAWASGGPQYASQGGFGVSAPNGSVHYVALSATAGQTTVETIGRDGSVWNWPRFSGTWGVPLVTYRDGGGLSHDGRTLVLQTMAVGVPTSFLVLQTRDMRTLDRFTLAGTFSFDAFSPDASRLYLIQRVDATNLSRYVVRAYDLRTHTLLPGRIADRTQRGWVMQGDAATRTTSPGGRFVYTLYLNPGGYPFIHALDTVRGVAHCIGLPWTSPDQSGLQNVVLTLHGSRLAAHWRSGKGWLSLDTTTWRLSRATGSGFPYELPALAALAALAALVLVWRRRRPRGTLRPREA